MPISRAPANAKRILVKGENHSVAVQFEMFEKKGNPVYYWADNGLVHWEDSKDNTYGSMYWQDAARRVLALSEMTIKSSEDGYYADERKKLQSFICDMEEVIRKAREQGGPLDDGVLADRQRARRKAVIVPREVTIDF